MQFSKWLSAYVQSIPLIFSVHSLSNVHYITLLLAIHNIITRTVDFLLEILTPNNIFLIQAFRFVNVKFCRTNNVCYVQTIKVREIRVNNFLHNNLF